MRSKNLKKILKTADINTNEAEFFIYGGSFGKSFDFCRLLKTNKGHDFSNSGKHKTPQLVFFYGRWF